MQFQLKLIVQHTVLQEIYVEQTLCGNILMILTQQPLFGFNTILQSDVSSLLRAHCSLIKLFSSKNR